MGDKVKIITIR